MMYWHNGGMSGWGWFGMSLGMLLVTALLVIGGVLLFWSLDRTTTHPAPPAPPAALGPTPPEQLLAARFARGKIDDQEYRKRLAALRDTAHP
ncbi:SHOCT domain-containing protein [Kitasatospora cathayae]|uniref:SHOCT domain-containing protein n=2 Tax=Kitasatospora cathayae TaxID=3004092 RepID=A0ABY7QFA5_9ACTN|nr:SHOCT domain-containing protein [Kitasatospora sp. HUAS 3-15]WBP91455.1 SHOCT domain-containing protein [Kitasatospora sp. HUAS 3-15]